MVPTPSTNLDIFSTLHGYVTALRGEAMRYQSGNVTVDDNFARVGSKSYAINKINSVDVRSKKKSGKWGWLLWWLLAIFCGVPALGALIGGQPGEAVAMLLIAALFGYFGWKSYQQRHATYSYELFLMTSSNEVQAFVTDDKDDVLALRSAIEDAMAAV